MIKMKLISWNIHNGLTENKYSHINSMNPDILILLECKSSDFEYYKNNYESAYWYNDTLYDNKSNLGIALFSNKYTFEFAPNFNRNYRYVIPIIVKDSVKKLFTLFVVWTKKEPFTYSNNVTNAVSDECYRKYLNEP